MLLNPSLRWITAELQLEDSGYLYDRQSQRYRNTRSGRWISESQMEALTRRFVEQQKEKIDAIADRLLGGSTDLVQWEAETAAALKQLNLGQYVLGRGGLRQMEQRDYGIIGARLRSEYGYLRGFTQAINDGEIQSIEQFRARLDLYSNHSRSLYEQGRREAHIAADFRWEMRELRSQESCPECPGFANTWQPIGALPRIGEDCSCQANCKCVFRYARGAVSPGGAEARYLGAAARRLFGG